jgi:hypothetical protein
MNITQETLELMKAAHASPSDTLSKSISIGTGLLAFDLQAPAKNLYPFVTPLRNTIPRVGGGTGSATNWRQVNAIIGSGFDAMGWVPEGQRSGQMSYSTSNKAATYATIGEEDAATFEAIAAGRSFEDIQAMMVFRLLQKMMLKEEMAILCGNTSLALGVPATPTVSAVANTASTLTTNTSPGYFVKVVALTAEGFQNIGSGNGAIPVVSAATVVPTSKSISGADGKNYVLNGGCSNLSAESAGQSITSGTNMLAMTVTAVRGAVAYAWFISGASGTETLQAITTINSYTQSVPLTTGTQSAATINADYSTNSSSLAYDGLLTTAFNSANNATVTTMATGTAGTGTPLTASGRGSINEMDTLLLNMWQNFELSPTVFYVNAQELKNITTKVLSNTSGPLLRYDTPATGGEYRMTASGFVEFYYNPFAMDGGLKIPIKIHPRVPPGTIVGWAENLPIQYQSNEVPNVAEIKTRQDYYQVDCSK